MLTTDGVTKKLFGEKRMKILGTGVTGFIGSYLIRALLAEGHKVRATFRSGSTSRVADVEWHWVEKIDSL